MKKLLLWLALPPALLLFLFSLAVAGVLASSVPPLVMWVAVALCLLVGAWFFFGRRGRNESAGQFSESAFATKSTKEGLL
jgi:hypothetical protein